MIDIDTMGRGWLDEKVAAFTEEMAHLSPSEYNEQNRYLPNSVTSKPGYIRYAVNPFMREIVDCFDVDSPVREVNVMKGVQITYSTLLESGVMYYADYIGTLPMMYITADKELATARIENNFIPMFNQSGKGDLIRSSDVNNPRKTGKTANHLQFAKGAYLVPFGAQTADKMRSYSIAIMLKDEIDAWPLTVGRDGDPDALTDARTDGYTEVAKIFRGSTPLRENTSVIYRNYKRGDQRIYMVRCKHCNHPQPLRWSDKNGVGGFFWEMDGATLALDSVHYRCFACGHKHYEYDKTALYSEENGAYWKPTAKPATPFIRSYHIPALYSPVGMRPWWKCVSDYLESYDDQAKQIIDIGKYQVFYNNVLAEPFRDLGGRVTFQAASGHRRPVYGFGQIPNSYAAEYSGGRVLFLTCQVDVHDSNLAVAVMGWTKNARCYVIDYWRFERGAGEPACSELSSPQWSRVQGLIDGHVYTADDGQDYRIAITLVDAGYCNDVVTSFCSNWASGVYPILGVPRPKKNQTIREFTEFKTQMGTTGFRILSDHYKDRLAPVLRREWVEASGLQPFYHLNLPADVSNAQINELTAEYLREKNMPDGSVVREWHRPGNKPNELWDLWVYGSAAVELFAWSICIETFKLKTVDWEKFWEYCAATESDAVFARDS